MQQHLTIVGDGIVGLLLAWLLKDKVTLTIYGNGAQTAASIHGAAVFNPLVYYPKGNEYYQLVKNTATNLYASISEELGTNYLHKLTLITDKNTPKESPILQALTASEQQTIAPFWKQTGRFQKVEQALKIDTQITHDLRTYFHNKGQLINKEFVFDANEHKGTVLFCEGAFAKHNPLFSDLKLTANKGDIIYAHIPLLPEQYIYDFDYKLVPIGNGNFWIGSNHIWQYNQVSPEPAFFQQVSSFLHNRLQTSATLLSHIAVERPTIAGQQPVFAWHKKYPNVAIINGLGTKGFSFAPYFCHQVVQQLPLNNN